MFDTFWLVQLLRVSPLLLCVVAVGVIAVRDALLRTPGGAATPAA